jgi:hypothetical protein
LVARRALVSAWESVRGNEKGEKGCNMIKCERECLMVKGGRDRGRLVRNGK